ncbi:ervatamin-B-like [Daphnia pulex]|uniref:ervatamin-B-like n=1 Tax=Daphnia pulex TaxID=6669 RepID=UPI001EE0B007|nr:ervatamin-B-like [Daphnia pulex]
MKLFFVLAAFAMAVSVVNGYSDDDAWKDYKKKHKLDYNIEDDGGKRDGLRKKIFLNNREKINKHNSHTKSYLRKLNQFAAMGTWEKKRYLGVNPSKAPKANFLKSIPVNLQSRQLPSSLDYRFDPCMPEIKDQGYCGSCWAFTTITPLEFSQCKLTDSPVVLSEQHLVDCDNTNGGCNGGWYTSAWDYLQSNSGAVKETLYPYNAKEAVCKFKTSMTGAQVASYDYVQSNNATAMQVALMEYGPLATALTVIESFFAYGAGVYDDLECDGQSVNHAVVIVGWGNQNGVDYWVGRNSWGTTWGTNGYFLIQRGVNKCGIENYPAYVAAAA